MRQLRALVVDDEYAARETLCRLVDWQAFGFAPPVTASDGRQALALWRAERFDLVLTDIEMPVLGGIELIEAIRAEDPAQCIVIVSCHERFEYARRALQLGVDEYLIKDLLTEKELTAFLYTFVLQARQAAPRPGTQRDTLDDALRMAVTGAEPPTGWTAPGFTAAAVLAVTVDAYENQCVALGEEALLGQISASIESAEAQAHYYPGGSTCYLLYEVENNPSMLYYYTTVIGIAGAVRLRAKRQGLRSVSIGISNLCQRAAALGEACGQALEAVQMRMIIGEGRTTLYDTIVLRKSALDFRQTDYLLKCIEDFGHHANTACLRLVDKVYDVALPTSFADIHYYRYVNARLWAAVLAIARAQGRSQTALLAGVGLSTEDVGPMADSREMSVFFKNCLLSLLAGDEKPEDDNLVTRALRLIEREYTQDISLQYIADTLHTNKSYLSRLFKEQTGDSVMNYITKKKMARVKYLLTHTQMKLYEISDSLGIASPQYLSTVFKRYTGLSPNEFKKALSSDGLWAHRPDMLANGDDMLDIPGHRQDVPDVEEEPPL